MFCTKLHGISEQCEFQVDSSFCKLCVSSTTLAARCDLLPPLVPIHTRDQIDRPGESSSLPVEVPVVVDPSSEALLLKLVDVIVNVLPPQPRRQDDRFVHRVPEPFPFHKEKRAGNAVCQHPLEDSPGPHLCKLGLDLSGFLHLTKL